MNDRAADLRRALWLSVLSIAWSGVVGAKAAKTAIVQADRCQDRCHRGEDAVSALGLWWADAVAALIVGAIVFREGWNSLRATATA